MDDEDSYLYSEGKHDDRDPRKRKLLSPSSMNRHDERKLEKSRRRRQSSGSPDYEEHRHRQEEWKKKSEDFLKSLKTITPQEPRGNKIETFVGNVGRAPTNHSYGYSYAQPEYPSYVSAPSPGYGPPQPANYPTYRSELRGHTSDSRGPQTDPRFGSRESRTQSDSRIGETDRRDEDWRKLRDEREGPGVRHERAREERKEEPTIKETKNVVLTADKREKLVKQRQQYEKSAENLEEQLLKLKEQRESLKMQDHKHEDTIMKENAKLQKEVKHRIQYLKELIDKLDKGLEEDSRAKERELWREEELLRRKEAERIEAERKEMERKEAERKEIERKEMERKEAERKELERKELERKEAERKDAERKEAERKEAERKWESSPETMKLPMIKKDRDSSSDSLDSTVERKKKKKRKKSIDTDSSDSDSDNGKIKNLEQKIEDEILRYVSKMKTKKRKGNRTEDNLLGMLEKLTDGYNKTKQENAELTSRNSILENRVKMLKRQIDEMQSNKLVKDTSESRTVRALEPPIEISWSISNRVLTDLQTLRIS